MRTTIRPPAVPLVTVDPYFSVWSMADNLSDDYTRHWTGKRNAMTGLIMIDDSPWRFAGLVEPNGENYYTEPKAMQQTDLQITPLSSIYTFEQSGISLKVSFMTPLLLDDLDLVSRPASYVSFAVRSIDGKSHKVEIYFDVTGEWCVNTSDQKIVSHQEELGELAVLQMGNAEQEVLNQSGDDVRIDWGQFYMAVKRSPNTRTYIGTASMRKEFVKRWDINPSIDGEIPRAVKEETPVMACVIDCGAVGSEDASHLIVLAYDDIFAIEYFGDKLQAYWKRNGLTTSQMLLDAFSQYPQILKRCGAFDQQLWEDGVRAGGQKYAELMVLAYRQAIAAHKLVEDRDGNLLFLSKECYSNGCAATVDVSYPSIPLFLLYNPELVKAMMRPIFKYAKSEAWRFEFAPHDVGQYPLANGQVYSDNAIEGQMPIEECGNMLIMAAAVCLVDKQGGFAKDHWQLLTGWANYLVEFGLDPANQLCTDDFAGHLARNANLSIKAIMGIASFGLLHELLGHVNEAELYKTVAKDMAVKWELMAKDQDHYQLAFGQKGTWSLKYNLIWDVIFGTEIFNKNIIHKEVAWYIKKQDKYGTPLDSREAYTKSDWLVWAASLVSNQNDFEKLIEPLWDSLNESDDRIPFTDWYDTKSARQMNFQHRSVVGGMYMKLLKDKWNK